jgi:DNA polymerase-3 subunit epsilon
MRLTNNYEELALTLAANADYRVLRRLKDKEQYNQQDGTPVKIGLILDTETTGLDVNDRVLELGILRFEFDPLMGTVYRILDSYAAQEDPGIRISESATAVHGITAAMVRGKRFDDAAVKRIAADADLVIAHNARFDRPMIEKRYPLFALLNWSCSYQEIDWKSFGFGGASLEYLAYKHGFFYEAHGAEMDCRALLEILQSTPNGGINYLKLLLASLGRVEERIWAINAPFDRKDLLKERGYRWNSEDPKAWWISCSRTEARAERRWLLKTIYEAASANLRIDVIDSTARYSNRLTDSRTRRVTLDEPV